jgi:hypothetical protein
MTDTGRRTLKDLLRTPGVGFKMMAGAFAALMLALTALVWASGTAPMVIVDVRATQVSYTIQRPPLSQLPLRGAIVARADGFCDALLDEKGRLTALVAAPKDTMVTYIWHRNFVQITLSPPLLNKADPESWAPVSVEKAGAPRCVLAAASATFLLPHAAMRDLPPLPILGQGNIGAELGIPPAPEASDLKREIAVRGTPARKVKIHAAPGHLLLGGTARVMGRTSLWWDSGKLFPVADSDFIIPRGSRLSSNASGAPLIGNLVLADGADAFDIQVTTEAKDLSIHRMGANAQEEALAFGALARSFGDPSLAPILIPVAIVGFLIQIFFGLEAMIRERWGPKK